MSNILSANSKTFNSNGSSVKNRDFEPTQLLNLRLWLRADLGVTLSGNNVTAWADQSKNSFNMSQGTAAQQPIYIPSGLNQKPAIRFDGVDDLLTSSSTVLTGTGDFSIFTVTTKLATTADNHICGNYSSTNPNGLQCWLDASNRISLYRNPVTLTGTTPVIASQTVILYWQRVTGTASQRLNETSEGSIAMAGSIVGTTNWSIANYAALLEPYNGDIYEHIVFDRALTETERMQISNYFRQRYGI